ncbi:MAG: DUF3592 domain-containing protein [Fuerstiella sp.]
MGRLLLGFLGIVFFLIGGGLILWIGLPTLNAAKASKAWPTVDGIVIESKVRTKKSNDRKDGPTYQAVVLYDYQVEGQEYSSDRIWFGGEISTSNRSQMRNIVKEYKEGEATTVYFDPQNPEEAVLQPGAFFTSYFMIIFGSVFAAPGAIMTLVAAFVMKSKPSTTDSNTFGRQHDNMAAFDDNHDQHEDDDFYGSDNQSFDSNWNDDD